MEEGKLVPAGCKKSEIKPDECVNNECPRLCDERFDFDLSLSPSSENEDEVFVGPMGHKEKCIAVSIETCEGAKGSEAPLPTDDLMWSPLPGEKFAEIFKEAHLVALQLQSASKTKKRPESVERFVQESKSKLKIFEAGIKTERTPRAVKRETYCVCESPVSQLPPSLQKHPRQPIRVTDSLPSPLMPQKVSSPKTGKLSRSFVMQAAQGCGDKADTKGSKLQAVKASYVFGKNCLAVEQSEQESPHPPSNRIGLKSVRSLEDLLPSKSTIVPDAKDSSLDQDKRMLPILGKTSTRTTQLKLHNDVQMRRSTLSSSSSLLSSTNSSLDSSSSISPKRGRVTTNMFVKTSGRSSSVSSDTTKIALVRPMRVSSVPRSHSNVSDKQDRSAGAVRGNPLVSAPKDKAGSESKASSSRNQGTGSDPRRQKSSQKGRLQDGRGGSRSETKTVSSARGGSVSQDVAVRALQPIALLPCGNVGRNIVGSPPIKQSEEQTVLNSCSSLKSVRTPASIRRSGLPTPVGHRTSGIPARTPKTKPMSSPNLLPACQASRLQSKKSSAARTKEGNMQATHSSTSSNEGDLFPPHTVSVALNFSPEKASPLKQDLSEDQNPVEETHVKEGILIDIGIDTPPVAPQECENKPLIDFFNTPEMTKPVPLKTTEQLVGLGSPFIYLSPEGNKENLDFSLLKF